jgi:ribulose 1,5-bisphosphate carboxylase large subunit-like protein
MPVFSSGQTARQPAETFKRLGSTDLIYAAGGGIIKPSNITGLLDTQTRRPVTTAVTEVIGDEKVPTPNYINIDIRQEQQDAKIKAYLAAKAAGKSEAEAQNAEAAAGNLAGAAALEREGRRAGLS